jgi:FkbM family methyltransferase
MTETLEASEDRIQAARQMLARGIIAGVHLPWRVGEKLLRRRLPQTHHYVIMRIFRGLWRTYPVTVRYRNPIAAEPAPWLRLSLDLCENNQQWHFRLKETFEQEWVRLIAEGMREAEAFVDIGANVGMFALTVAQAFPESRVIAVEPLEANARRVRGNVALNSLNNVSVRQAAVADASGTISFHVNPIHDGGGSILDKAEYTTGDVRLNAEDYRRRHPKFTSQVDVEAVRLDDLVSSKSVLKIDVEGAELGVLESGRRALSKGLVDLAVVEVREDTMEPVIEFLNSVGLDCFLHGQSAPLHRRSGYPKDLTNLLCLRRGSRIHERQFL